MSRLHLQSLIVKHSLGRKIEGDVSGFSTMGDQSRSETCITVGQDARPRGINGDKGWRVAS